jgi:hypothetical protein
VGINIKLKIKDFNNKIVEIDFTNENTLDEILNRIAQKTDVKREMSVFLINGSRTFVNDEPSQNYINYLKGFGVDTSQESIQIHQVLTLGSGPYYRRGPNTTTILAAQRLRNRTFIVI